MKSALTRYYLGPTSLAPGICGSSYSAVVCWNAASLSLSTENLTTFALLFARHTRKSLIVAPASLSTPFMPCWMACLAASVLATFSAAASPTRLTSITSCRLCSLSVVPLLVVRDSVVPDLAGCPPAATDAHVCVDGGSIEMVSSCARSDPIVSWSSEFCLLRYCCSSLIAARSVRMLSMLLLWLAMMLFCCAIISLRLAMSCATSFSWLLLPPLSSWMDSRPLGKGGSSSCAGCSVFEGPSFCGCCVPVAPALFRTARRVVVRVCRVFWVSSTLVLGFLARPLGTTGGGVDGVRSGVDGA
ncbi:hypothetical protein BKA66DRAFT_601956, partial [Pyrenochaeta sp. MPI-SDFR-AT-0127]